MPYRPEPADAGDRPWDHKGFKGVKPGASCDPCLPYDPCGPYHLISLHAGHKLVGELLVLVLADAELGRL